MLFLARSRSKRRREAGILNSGNSLISVESTEVVQTGVTAHNQLTGVISMADGYGDSARDLHLTAKDADKIKDLDLLDKKYLRKDRDDTANGIISFVKDIRGSSSKWKITSEGDTTITSANVQKDIQLGGGISSSGWKITSAGYANLNSAAVQKDILVGEKISSTGYIADFNAGKGWEVSSSGAAMLNSALVRSDILIGGRFGSMSFESGFTGSGVDIDIPSASATFDFMTVRKSMKVYELVYSQIYGLGGSVIVSDLNKILTVQRNTGFYRCEIDTMDDTMRMNLRNGDIVRMQRSSGINIRYFYGEIINVTPDYFDLRIIDGIDVPEPGDVVFRFGNKTDKNRQGLLYLTSSDDKAPYLDILDGMTDSSMQDKVKVRLGNLSGIRTKTGKQLNKYGIYAQGAVFEDTDIYLEDGTTVSQQFSILNGKLESKIEGIKSDMSLEVGNILKNSSFNTNLNYWNSQNDVSFITPSDTFLWFDGHYYSEKRAVADIYSDSNKNVLRLRKISITQDNDVMNGEKTEGIYSFSLFYKVTQPGILTVGFAGQELYIEENLGISNEYNKLFKVAQWDGIGNFRISFTGEILIYGVSFFNDALANATIKLSTEIKQTAEEIKLSADKLTEYINEKDGKVRDYISSSITTVAGDITLLSKRVKETESGIEETNTSLKVAYDGISAVSSRVKTIEGNWEKNSAGWITQPEGHTIWAKKEMEDGKTIVAAINITDENVTIDANKINLNGAISTTAFKEDVWDILNSKVNSSSLNGYIPRNQIESAMQEEGLIVGGYMKMNLIDVENLYAKKLAAIEGTVGPFKIGTKKYESKWYKEGEFERSSLVAIDNIDYSDGENTIRRHKKIELGGTAITMMSTTSGGGKSEGKWGTAEIILGPGSVDVEGKMMIGNNVLFDAPADASLLIRSRKTFRPVDMGIIVELFNEKPGGNNYPIQPNNQEYGRATFFLGRKRIWNPKEDFFRTIELGSHAFQHEPWNHFTYIRMDNMATENQELPNYDQNTGIRVSEYKLGVEKKDMNGVLQTPKVVMWDPATGYMFASNITITKLKELIK